MALTGIFDLDAIILNHLSDEELEAYSQVNPRVKTICDREQFWISRIMKKFPRLNQNDMDKLRKRTQNSSWQEIYESLEEKTIYLSLGPWEEEPSVKCFTQVSPDKSNFTLRLVGDNETIRGGVIWFIRWRSY